MKYKIYENLIIDTEREDCPFKSGTRVEIIGINPLKEQYEVMDQKGNRELIAEKELRESDPIDDYEDMYCNECGGTSCLC